MPAKKDAAYWRDYRAKRAAREPIIPEKPPEEVQQVRDTRVARIEPEVIHASPDRANGLPRTNYYGDWVPTIRKMTGKQIDAILNHPAVKTSSREKK